MELIRVDFNNLSKINDNLVATIGQFDGLHVAHLYLIEKTKEIAKEKGLKSCLITFDPHPDFILKKTKELTYVTPLNQKEVLLNKLDIDYLLVIRFDKDVASMSPIDFVNKILVANNVKEVVVGFDFGFGYKAAGKAKDINSLSNGKIKTHIIDEIKYNNQKIGTTLVKTLLSLGRVKEVSKILGRYYSVKGVVISGNQVGRKINFPTANLKVTEEFANLLNGVYVVRVNIDSNKYLGIANLGHNPSFNQVDNKSFEAHIIDFNGDLYNKTIEVELIEYIRAETKFASVYDFLTQISKDLDFAKEISKKYQLF